VSTEWGSKCCSDPAKKSKINCKHFDRFHSGLLLPRAMIQQTWHKAAGCLTDFHKGAECPGGARSNPWGGKPENVGSTRQNYARIDERGLETGCRVAAPASFDALTAPELSTAAPALDSDPIAPGASICSSEVLKCNIERFSRWSTASVLEAFCAG